MDEFRKVGMEVVVAVGGRRTKAVVVAEEVARAQVEDDEPLEVEVDEVEDEPLWVEEEVAVEVMEEEVAEDKPLVDVIRKPVEDEPPLTEAEGQRQRKKMGGRQDAAEQAERKVEEEVAMEVMEAEEEEEWWPENEAELAERKHKHEASGHEHGESSSELGETPSGSGRHRRRRARTQTRSRRQTRTRRRAKQPTSKEPGSQKRRRSRKRTNRPERRAERSGPRGIHPHRPQARSETRSAPVPPIRPGPPDPPRSPDPPRPPVLRSPVMGQEPPGLTLIRARLMCAALAPSSLPRPIEQRIRIETHTPPVPEPSGNARAPVPRSSLQRPRLARRGRRKNRKEVISHVRRNHDGSGRWACRPAPRR